MKYRGYYISIEKADDIVRENKDLESEHCEGFSYRVFDDKELMHEIDNFTAAKGYEIPDMSKENAEMFAREMIDIQLKEYEIGNEKCEQEGGVSIAI